MVRMQGDLQDKLAEVLGQTKFGMAASEILELDRDIKMLWMQVEN